MMDFWVHDSPFHHPRELYEFKMERRYLFSCCPVRISLETLHISSPPHCPWKSHEWCLNCVREMCTLTGLSRADRSVSQHTVILWNQPHWPLNPPLPLPPLSASASGLHMLKLFLFHACELDTTMKNWFLNAPVRLCACNGFQLTWEDRDVWVWFMPKCLRYSFL